MYYATVRIGYEPTRKAFKSIKSARLYVMKWMDDHPRSMFKPTISSNGRVLEYIIRGDSPMEYMVYDDRGYHYTRKDGSLTPVKRYGSH